MISDSSKATYNTVEVAVIFNVTNQTVRLWIKKGRIQTTKTPGGRIRIPREEVDRFRNLYSD